MATLLLLRHAKSSWRDGTLDDHDRPLNARGRGAADRMADHLRSVGLLPDLALVSTAARTEETWARMQARWEQSPEVTSMQALYLASPDRLLAALRTAPDSAKRLLLLGHNPGLQQLALQLSGPGSDNAALTRLRGKFPTCGLAVFRVDLKHWRDLAGSRSSLIDFRVAREFDEP